MGSLTFQQALTRVGVDRAQAEPARFTANAFAGAGVPAYIHRFSYVQTSRRAQLPEGVPHAAEIPFVLNNLTSPSADDSTVGGLANTYWANYAKSGDPNSASVPAWPRYFVGTNAIVDFRPDATIFGGVDPRRDRLDVAEALGGLPRPR